jgi:uncharacterized protein YwqG
MFQNCPKTFQAGACLPEIFIAIFATMKTSIPMNESPRESATLWDEIRSKVEPYVELEYSPTRIEAEDLAKLNFSRVFYTWDCC